MKKIKKLEEILKDRGYKVVYAAGNFSSGYCRVKDSNVILVNKFFDQRGRMLCLQEILNELDESKTQQSVADV